MLSLGQKVLAVATLLFIDLVSLIFFPIMGIVGFLFTVPLAIVILKR